MMTSIADNVLFAAYWYAVRVVGDSGIMQEIYAELDRRGWRRVFYGWYKAE
jgi:hypothetical protein